MNILIFRSIRSEEMGYVVEDIHSLYPENHKVNIITNNQQSIAMKNIEGVDDIIIYTGNNFNFYKDKLHEIKEFKKINFSKIIIPTNGNIESYSNVYKFAKKNFNFEKIYFYIYPKKLISLKNNIFYYFYKKLIFIISIFLAIPFALISLILIYIRSLIR